MIISNIESFSNETLEINDTSDENVAKDEVTGKRFVVEDGFVNDFKKILNLLKNI